MTKFLYLSFFIFSTLCFSQEIKLNKGDFEVNLGSTFSQGEIDVEAGFGAFLADYSLLRLDLGYSDTQPLDRSSLGVSLVRFFETRTYTIPYVGIGLGYVTITDGAEEDLSGAEFSLLLGLRYYLAENVGLNAEFKTAYATEEAYLDGAEPVDTDYGFRIGLSYLW